MSGIRTTRNHFEIGNSAVRRRCQKMTESEAYWGPGTNWYGDEAWGQPAWGQSAWGQSLTSGQTPVWDESAGPPHVSVQARSLLTSRCPPTPPTPITWTDLERRARNPDVAEIRAAWECFFRAGQEPRVSRSPPRVSPPTSREFFENKQSHRDIELDDTLQQYFRMRITDKEAELIRNKMLPEPLGLAIPVSRPGHLSKKKTAPDKPPLIYCANGPPMWRSIFRRRVRKNPGLPRLPLRQNQWKRWTNDVIPKLIPVFLALWHKTESLRNIDGLELPALKPCGCKKRKLDVAVVRWSGLEHIHIEVCACQTAAEQLLTAGLFPCSPQRPSLAVDVGILEFVKLRGFKLTTKDTLRVRFGNALEWYTTLRNRVATEIDKLMDAARHILRGEELDNDPEPPVSDASTSQPSAAASGEPAGATPGPNARATRHATGEKRRRPHASDDDDSDDESPPDAPNPFPEPPPRTRPSDYLLSRCPACFGGLEHDPSQKVDIDKGGRDPPRTHPGTHFVPEETAEKMDEHVDGVRPAKNSQAKQARVEDEADGFEGDMKVPRSVLDECESSFKAADEKREKASTQFFDDTGIMALLCRHDRVLWLVNMRTPGEKQYYALALLETLFQHLPSNIRVGVLYDIACQLHRSCTKFGFLGRYLHRILFAVAEDLASRTERDANGFGTLSANLFPYLRVAGYHHRLHTIDSQVEHADKASLRRLGAWLVRRTVHCEDKLQEATKELAACGVAETVLREEWEKQVKAQTKPAERRSKTRGSAAVEEVILLRKRVDALFQKMTVLHDALADTQSTAHVLLYAQTHADAARNAWQKEQQRLRKLEQQLGVTDKTALEKLRHSDYYAARMNAKVLKDRVRQRLRERKFELDLIERSFRRTRSENQKNEHAAAAIKRREPTINNNVRDYNKLCAEISTLIQGKRAPAGAVAPTPIPVKGIFQLDVDDAIWQDLGLDDDTTPARWLVDANVRAGIRAMLQKDRCEEEAPRLQRERRHMQMWFATEWAAVKHAIELSHGAVRYQFELKRKELLQLCVVWRKSLDALPPAGDLPAWGPTKEEIEDCEIEGVTASYEDGEGEDNERSSESDDETSSEDEDEDEEDEDLLYVIEAVERADIHRRRDTEEAEWATNDEDIFM
ncbi:hypothetical protein MSAN_00866300 [Mycena sanguinolenta]|uniref:CxC2-like cysteine cluster KDZ transposase-associated domain-containing protein n=1 Tax=Mycena sanguinolenta TaxID=230812 RepID=A0A8H7DB67_9AGAR|nr:hypothetical protein MSAN_00866300 [Mycena sanguinolenta]